MKKRNIQKINISDVVLDTAQPRQEVEKSKLNELAKDILERGLLYPIILTPFVKKDGVLIVGEEAYKDKSKKWWVCDGERRIRAYSINKQTTIEAEIRLDLEFYEMVEIQFAANCKRVQITVKEMAKAVKRFRKEHTKKHPNSNPIHRLVELTGYSESYFDNAEAINRAPKEMQKKINEDKVGGYTPGEIEKVSKDKSIRKGLTKVYLKRAEQGKKTSALAPRAIKPKLKKLEKKPIASEQKTELAESILEDFVSKDSENGQPEKEYKKSNFLKYKYETEDFLERVNGWDLNNLTEREINELIGLFTTIQNVFVERRRKLNMLFTNTKSENIGVNV